MSTTLFPEITARAPMRAVVPVSVLKHILDANLAVMERNQNQAASPDSQERYNMWLLRRKRFRRALDETSTSEVYIAFYLEDDNENG